MRVPVLSDGGKQLSRVLPRFPEFENRTFADRVAPQVAAKAVEDDAGIRPSQIARARSGNSQCEPWEQLVKDYRDKLRATNDSCGTNAIDNTLCDSHFTDFQCYQLVITWPVASA